MSVQAITWALDQKVGSPTGKIVLLCLANYADKHGNCFPGHNTIAKECEISRRSVVEWMNKLQELGFIERHRRHRNNGSRSSDSVVLLMPEPEKPTSGGQGAESAHRASLGAADDNPRCSSFTPYNRKGTVTPLPPRSKSGEGDGGKEELVALSETDPLIPLLEQLRGKPFIFGRSGKVTVTAEEIAKVSQAQLTA